MKNTNHLLCGLFLLLAVSGTVSSKDWRSIAPLRSTLEDVEKLLGRSTIGSKYIYETEEGRIFFFYQSDPNAACGNGSTIYNVPFGTIFSIQIESKKKPLLVDLNLNMSKFRRYATCIGAIGYYNAEEGFEMHVYNDVVSTFYYQPSAADAKQFACSKANEQKAAGS